MRCKSWFSLFNILPLLTFGILCKRLLISNPIPCRTNALIYLVMDYLIFFLILVTISMLMTINNNSKRSYFVIILVMELISFFCINLIGMFPILEELFSTTTCFYRFDWMFLTFALFITFLEFIMLGLILVFSIKSIILHRMNRRIAMPNQTRDPEIVRNDFIRRNLKSIYSNPKRFSKKDLEKFLSDPANNEAMMKLPALSNEIELFKKHFSYVSSEKFINCWKESDENSCPVCYVDFLEMDQVYIFTCFHRFHESCLQEWFSKKVACPVCKANIRHLLIDELIGANQEKEGGAEKKID